MVFLLQVQALTRNLDHEKKSEQTAGWQKLEFHGQNFQRYPLLVLITACMLVVEVTNRNCRQHQTLLELDTDGSMIMEACNQRTYHKQVTLVGIQNHHLNSLDYQTLQELVHHFLYLF